MRNFGTDLSNRDFVLKFNKNLVVSSNKKRKYKKTIVFIKLSHKTGGFHTFFFKQ